MYLPVPGFELTFSMFLGECATHSATMTHVDTNLRYLMFPLKLEEMHN